MIHRDHPATNRSRAWATQLTVPGAVVSHCTAAQWHGFPLDDVHLTQGHATRTPASATSCRRPDIVLHTADLTPADVFRFAGGLAVTSEGRTAVDCLALLPPDAGLALWAWVSTRRILDRGRLSAAARSRLGRPGTPNLLWILRVTAGGAVSVAERRLHDLLRKAGVTGWSANAPVLVDGRIVAVADVLFGGAGLVVEVDGLTAHRTPGQLTADRRRQNILIAAGYRVLRYTWVDLRDRPDQVVA
ncbi:DUF559 domain-containing protein [Spongisporangium articulatum]|uniref:DUF559 domain-containing protein n=1 Tax=Spongisporangium articulatum TaxID=3362603 RepID=A0ABW8ANX9_9ACTN